MTKSDVSIWTLSGANTYTGPTLISAGTLRIGDGNTTGSLVTGSTITNNAALVFNRSDAPTQGTDFASVISGTGSVTQAGAGNLILNGVNTYTGGTTVSSGTLTLNGTPGGTGVIRADVTVNAGATLQLASTNALGYDAGLRVTVVNIVGGLLNDTATGDQGFSQTYNLTGGTMQSNGGVSNANATQYYAMGTGSAVNSLASATTSTLAGRINLRADGGFGNLTFTVADGAAATDLLVSEAITENLPTIGITKSGAGVMQVSALHTYTGATVIAQGTLSASNILSGGASNIGNTNSAVILGDATHKGTLSYTGNTATYTRGFNVVTGGGEIDTATSGQTLTIATTAITSASNGNVTIGGAGNTIVGAGIQIGSGAVTKEGAGTVTLAGAQTYASLTTSGGITNVNTAIGSGTSTVTANATTNFFASQTLASLTIGAGVEVSFGVGLPFAGEPEKFAAAALIPEPGSLGLLLVGALGVAGRRRRQE